MTASEAQTQIWVGSGSDALNFTFSSASSLKMSAKTGMMKATTISSDDRSEAEDQRRIHHRRFDLAAQGVGFLDLKGDPVEDVFEPPRLLAGADHRPVELVEDVGMARHRLLEGAAGLDVGAEAGGRLADLLVLGLLLEGGEGAQHRHPRRDEGRELAREDASSRVSTFLKRLK